MRSPTLLAAGSWALALLLGFFIWLSPDAGFYPAPAAAGAVIGLAFLLWVVGAFRTGFPVKAPRLSLRVQIAALAPMVAAAVALILAGRGLLPHPLLPLLVITVGGAAGWWWGRGVGTAPTTPGQELIVAGALIPVVLITGPALVIAVWGQQLWMIAAPNYATMTDRYEAAAAFTPYRPAAHPGISPETAGLALLTIANTGDARRDSLFVETPASLARPWIADSGPFGRRSGDSVMIRALAGLDRAERAWLEEAVGHPGLPLLDTVAYAARLDPWAGLRLPLPPSLNALALPIPNIMPIRNAARLQLYRAALAAADRKPAVAESLVRNVIGLGLRLREDGDQLIVAVIGAAITREAGATLAVLRNARGHTPEGDSLARLALPRAPVARTDSVLLGTRPMDLRRQLLDAIITRTAPRPVQWDIAGLLGVSRCTDLRELFYGPSPQLQAAYAAVGEQAGPSPQAQAAFEVVGRGITRGAEGSTPLLLRPFEMAVGQRAVGACLGAVTIM